MWAASCCAACACEESRTAVGRIGRCSAHIAYCGLFTPSPLASWVLREVAAPLLAPSATCAALRRESRRPPEPRGSPRPRRLVLTVDIEGKAWRRIRTPRNFTFIGLSQGHLYAMHKVHCHDSRLAIWVLKDYGAEQWELKHDINPRELIGKHNHKYANFYNVIAIHPESSLIFLTAGSQRNLMSYDLDRRKLHDICALGEYCVRPHFPYIPCFLEWLSNED